VDELTILFLVLAVVLAVVTVVGHGIWVLLASMFGGRRKSTNSPMLRPALGGIDGMAALRAMRRQLEVFAQQGALDAETRAPLAAVIDEQERRLVQKAANLTAPPIVLEAVAAATPLEPAGRLPAAIETPSPPVPLAERARVYAASRGAAISEALAEPVAPAEPPKRREALSRLFAAFMEEKNIRWGELVGGLLIVGCSIALVISLWSQIVAQPLLKFVLFNGVTAALFGVGVYTDRRWKIHTTSFGVLVIATLLVPLNFLAIAAFTQASPPTDVLSLAGEGLSLIAFALLVYFAGRILVPREAVLLAAGVIVPCLMQLLIRRFAAPGTPLVWLYALAAVPIVGYLVTTSITTRRRWIVTAGGTADPGVPLLPSLAEVEANRVLLLLGMTTAAALMPLALLLHNVPPLGTTLHWLSPLAGVCGLPALLTGLLFWRRLTDRAHSGLQTAGIGIGALGAMSMAAAVVLAWPDPATLLPTAIVTAAAMFAVATWFAIPAAHVPAGLAIAAAWLTGFFLLHGDIGWTLDDSASIKKLFLSATSGHVLVPLVAVFGGLAEWLRRLNRHDAAKMYALVAAATATASLALVMWFGFAQSGDPANATWTLAVYALAALVLAIRLNRAGAARIGSVLLLAALGQGIVFRWNPSWQLQQPWIVVLLAHAALVGLGCAVLRIVATKTLTASAFTAARRAEVLRVLAFSALVTSLAAALWIIATCHATSATTLSIELAWLAGVWLILAALAESPALFTASQVGIVLAILCGVTAAVETRPWYASARRPWLDPWFLEAQGIGLAIYCLVLNAVRWGIGRELARDEDANVIDIPRPPRWLATAARLLDPPWPAANRVVSISIAAILALIATYAVLPGAAQELSRTEVVGSRVVSPIEQFQILGIPHAHAADRGAWLLLAAVAIAFSAQFPKYFANWRRVGLVAVGVVMCLLLAARWESQVAVASALRWLSAGFLAMASAAAWAVDRAAVRRRASPGAAAAEAASPSNRNFRELLVGFNVWVYAAMGAYVAQSALMRSTMDANVQNLWPWVVAWALPLGLAALAFVVAAEFERRTTERLASRSAGAWVLQLRYVMMLLAIAPAAVLLTFVVAKALDGQPLVGPDPASWFRQIGFELSYGAPLVVVALTFIGYAILDRSSPFAFAAGLLFNVVATIVVLLRLARGNSALDAVAWINVAQVNAAVAAVVGLVWMAAIEWQRRAHSSRETRLRGPLLLITQVALAAALCGTFLVPATLRLAIEWSPLGTVPSWVAAAGSPLGWCGIGLATAAAVWLNGRRAVGQLSVAIVAAALVSMIALTVLRQGGGDWPAYHILLAGSCIAAWLLPTATGGANRMIAGSAEPDPANAWSAWPVRACDIAAVWLAIWEYSTAASWWVVGGLLAIGARNIVAAWRDGRRGTIWLAAVLNVFAASVWWLDILKKAAAMREIGDFFAFLWIDVLAVAAMAVISVSIERRWNDPAAAARRRPRGIAFHRFAAWAIVAVLLLTTAAGLIADLSSDSFAVNQPLAWAAWLAAAIVAAACLWDSAIRWPVPCLYCVGLIAVGMYLDGLDLRSPLFHWALANALAAYSLATSGLWSVRDRLRDLAARVGAPVAAQAKPQAAGESFMGREGGGHRWLVVVNFFVGIVVLLLVARIEQVVPSFTQRMVAAYAVGAQAFALGLLARGAVRTSLQYLALVWGVLFAAAFAWAWVPPDFAAPWLHRLVVTVAALAAVVVVYGFGLVKFLKRENEWTRAAARLVPPLAAVAAALIFVVLGIEVRAFVQHGSVPIAPAALVAVIVALAGLAVAALVAALVPGRDPLGLSERGRTLYVYLAEGLGALLFLHIRVTMPWLFTGWFQQFWPLIVMAIAFVGVGFGELFQRRQQRVLSEPLGTTGAILPLLPALGFWAVSSRVDYSLLLLSIGVLYAALSALRRSFLYGVLAALAANGSLWYFLHQREGLDLTEHPQLWLIPPALCALVAGYINRERLAPQQSATLRYASAIVIYVSSTADIFINGVADAPWLPAVLAGLSILGVLAGILLRVRAFLYLGTAFLVVALMTIIWHAAIEQQRTWILWVAGILTGVLIIALFGLFEKRRDDVLRVVEQLKHWEA